MELRLQVINKSIGVFIITSTNTGMHCLLLYFVRTQKGFFSKKLSLKQLGTVSSIWSPNIVMFLLMKCRYLSHQAVIYMHAHFWEQMPYHALTAFRICLKISNLLPGNLFCWKMWRVQTRLLKLFWKYI